MSTGRARKRGFTIVEAMVALALTGVAIAGVMTGVGSLTQAQTKMKAREKMQRLAVEKFNEIVAIQDFTTPSGDFTDRYEDNYLWDMQLDQVSTGNIPISSGTSSQGTSQSSQLTSNNLENLKVTVHPRSSTQTQDEIVISGLVYVPSQTSSTSTPTATGAGG